MIRDKAIRGADSCFSLNIRLMMGFTSSVVLALAAIVVIHDPLSICSPDHKLPPPRKTHLHVLPLEKLASPPKQQIDNLKLFRDRDRARHVRMLKGDVDFTVQGSSDPFKGG